tara:strand:+ start:409 stop:543 length:135 start_codon:yes stop_codon:yes gene_type:complete
MKIGKGRSINFRYTRSNCNVPALSDLEYLVTWKLSIIKEKKGEE